MSGLVFVDTTSCRSGGVAGGGADTREACWATAGGGVTLGFSGFFVAHPETASPTNTTMPEIFFIGFTKESLLLPELLRSG